MARIIVLAARNWSLKDEKTGEVRSGVKIEGTEDQVSTEKDYKGAGFVEYAASDEAWTQLSMMSLPAICDVEIGLRKTRDKSGKAVAVATIQAAKLIASVDFLAKKVAA